MCSTHGAYSPSGGVQTAQALALSIGAAPSPADAVSVLKALVADIALHDNHLTTGIIGTRFLLDALTAGGRADVALALVRAARVRDTGCTDARC